MAIECWLADTWQKHITELLGEPKVKINAWGTECDRFWKTKYNEIDITVHIWNKPKNKKGSKLMIQGSRQSVLCSYVFEELPKIYKLVCLNKPERIESSYSTRRIPGKPLVKCDQCKYKSTLLQMKMHMKTVHVTKPKRTKRSPNFTPVIKPAKKSRSDKIDPMFNCEGGMDIDNSFLLIDDSFSGKDNTAENAITTEKRSGAVVSCYSTSTLLLSTIRH